jgi:hypothetical protein
MTQESITRYRVKTTQGYFFTESNGRYGRLYGTAQQGEVMCEEHANSVEIFLVGFMPDCAAIREDYPGNAPCAVCKRKAKGGLG